MAKDQKEVTLQVAITVKSVKGSKVVDDGGQRYSFPTDQLNRIAAGEKYLVEVSRKDIAESPAIINARLVQAVEKASVPVEPTKTRVRDNEK